MFLETAFLDNFHREAFEQIALREGLIDEALPVIPDIFKGWELSQKEWARQSLEAYEARRPRITGKSKLLQAITLFEKIDTGFSMLDWSRLLDAGLISEESELSGHQLRLAGWPERSDGEQYNAHANRRQALTERELGEDIFAMKSGLRQVVGVDALQLMKQSQHRIVDQMLQQQDKVLPPDVAKFSGSEVSLAMHVFLWNKLFDLQESFTRAERLLSYPAHVLGDRAMLADLQAEFESLDRPKHLILKPLEFRFEVEPRHAPVLTWLDKIFDELQSALYYSERKGAAVLSNLLSGKQYSYFASGAVIDEVSYIVKTQLTDELVLLPNPSSLRQALKIREHPSMVQFREVLAHWCERVVAGDSAEVRIRKDLHRANRALISVERWHRYRRSPFNFWFSLLGGALGPLGTIVTVVEKVVDIVAERQQDRSSWLLLVNGSSSV